MNIFIILYLFVIIAALLLILYLVSKKEKFDPVALACRNKPVERQQQLPILYFYFHSEICDPSRHFKDKILTVDIQQKFQDTKLIDFKDFTAPIDPDSFPYVVEREIEYTPAIVIEYPLVIDEAIKNKIRAKSNLPNVEHVEEDVKHLLIIKNLDEYTPDNKNDLAESKRIAFNELINQMIITS